MAKRNLIQGFSKRGQVVETVDGPLVATRDTLELPGLNSLHWSPVVIRDESILPAAGKDGRDGRDAKDGRDGTDGKSVVFRGLWNRRSTYSVNDIVGFDGSSWICTANDTKGREPNDESRFWNVLAAKGERGRDGKDGLHGQRGRAVRQYEIEERLEELENADRSSVTMSAIFDSDTAAGEVVYISGDGHVDLSQANSEPQAYAVGIATANVIAGQTGEYIPVGPVTCETWSLTPGTVYYLDPAVPGGMTAVYPTTVGDFIVILGAAATPKQLNLEIHWANYIEE